MSAHSEDRPRCWCGVYVDCHQRITHKPRRAPRLRLWFVDHDPKRHILGWLWLRCSEDFRWRVVHRVHEKRPDLCWCDLVDAAYLDVKKDDYRDPWGCGCDVPRPSDARKPRPGRCYCTPPEDAAA